MTSRTLIRRSLRFYWRSHLGVWLGALVGSAALLGALVVGESVRESLKERALERVGRVEIALESGDRLFAADLAARLASRSERDTVKPGQVVLGPSDASLHLSGSATKQDGSARANGVQIYSKRFKEFSPLAEMREAEIHGVLRSLLSTQDSRGSVVTFGGSSIATPTNASPLLRGPQSGHAFINSALSTQLQARRGDLLLIRFRSPSALSQDAVLGSREHGTVALRVVVDEVVEARDFGDFSLSVGQRPPLNAFVNPDDIDRLIGASNQANVAVLAAGQRIPAFPNLPSSWRSSLWEWSHKKPTWLPEVFRRSIARLANADPRFATRIDLETTIRQARTRLKDSWQLGDAQIEVRAIEQPAPATGGEYIGPMIEIATRRIFLDHVVGEAALKPRATLITNHWSFLNDSTADLAAANYVTNGVPLITYLVNAIRFGDKLTPYSMVTAVGSPWTPADMSDDEVLVNEWLASDLGLKPGDRVELNYFDPESGARLLEKTNSFKVRAAVPMRGLHADRTLMPEFPGVASAESTGDWDTGFSLVHKIRDQDEAYWKQHRGTPKAFITLNAGRKMWASRFGTYTAVRYFVPTNGFPGPYQRIVEANLISNLDPSQFGLVFQPVREQALKAASESQDFGGLFIGFSFFLIVAALLLMAMLFTFGVEQRAAEIGTYLAVGFPLKQVRRMFLREGIAIATLGALTGTVAGVYYAKGMLWGLATIWSKAVGESALGLHYSPSTLLGGAVASVAVAAFAIWLTLRKQGRQPVCELLAGGGEELERGRARHSVRAESGKQTSKRRARSDAPYRGTLGTPRRSRGSWIGSVAGVLALGLVGFALTQGEAATADTFFGAGALLLIAGLGFTAGLLGSLARAAQAAKFTLTQVGVRGCARRRSRSLAVAAMLACGSFLILSIGAFRLDANRDATKRSSGTGGFTFIGETTLPVVQDLNTQAGRASYGLNERDLEGVSFVPFRVREGDEASCLNLNRAQQPRLLGVNPELLAQRAAFTFAKGEGWQSLRSSRRKEAPSEVTDSQSSIGDTERSKQDARQINRSLLTPAATNEVHAIGDANSIQWAMGKKIGDTIDYTDERGQPFKVRIVGAVANSVLQGQLIIDEAEFVRRFPSAAGYRYFLVDVPAQNATNLSAVLSRAFSDVGLELTPAATRLAQFNAVQNTYLNTFQILGGLGLLLGSAGLGVVVLRNVLERRGELALLLAVGFTRRLLTRVVLAEHVALLAVGLCLGVVAAAIAILPAMISPSAEPPSWSVAFLLAAVLVNGLVWTWLATRWALRGRLLDALRNE